VFLVANLTQIVALRHIGAPLVSSTMALRLVSALVFGGLVLGERLTSVWQGLGAAVVLVTITWYVSRGTGSPLQASKT
jgi:drug/metabolite transporter (DMT)-like permease